jgi:hypothetical protein
MQVYHAINHYNREHCHSTRPNYILNAALSEAYQNNPSPNTAYHG